GGSQKNKDSMEAITFAGNTLSSGYGFDAVGNDLEGLVLASADPGRSLQDTMSAFNRDGGDAAIPPAPFHQPNWKERARDIHGSFVGGVEVVRYSGWDGGTLKLSARGGAGLTRLADPESRDPKAFICYYQFPPGVNDPTGGQWVSYNDHLVDQVFV